MRFGAPPKQSLNQLPIASLKRAQCAATGPPSAGPESAGPESVTPASVAGGPESTGPESLGPASEGPESATPESTGPESPGPASTLTPPSTPGAETLRSSCGQPIRTSALAAARGQCRISPPATG